VFTPIPRATAIAEAAEYGMPLGLSPKKQRSLLEIFDEIAAAMEAL
jgi:chromosome partitioning protein